MSIDQRNFGIILVLAGALLAAPIYSESANRFATVFGAHFFCSIGSYNRCEKVARSIALFDPRQASALEVRVCDGTHRAVGCLKAADLRGGYGDAAGVAHALIKACRLNEPHACFKAATAATEAAFKSADADVNSPSDLEALALEAGNTGCDQNDAQACVVASTVYLFRNDVASESRLLYKACFQLRDSDSCQRYSQYLYYSGHFQQAMQTLLFTCGGKRNIGCEELFPEAFKSTDTYAVWLSTFRDFHGQWDELINAAYRTAKRPGERDIASVVSDNHDSIVESLAAARFLFTQAARSLRSLNGLNARRAAAQKEVEAYIEQATRLTEDMRRMLAGAGDVNLSRLKTEIDHTALLYRRADAAVRAANDRR